MFFFVVLTFNSESVLVSVSERNSLAITPSTKESWKKEKKNAIIYIENIISYTFV